MAKFQVYGRDRRPSAQQLKESHNVFLILLGEINYPDGIEERAVVIQDILQRFGGVVVEVGAGVANTAQLGNLECIDVTAGWILTGWNAGDRRSSYIWAGHDLLVESRIEN